MLQHHQSDSFNLEFWTVASSLSTHVGLSLIDYQGVRRTGAASPPPSSTPVSRASACSRRSGPTLRTPPPATSIAGVTLNRQQGDEELPVAFWLIDLDGKISYVGLSSDPSRYRIAADRYGRLQITED